MQPFAGAVSDFKIRRQAFYVFDDFFVDEGDAEFKAVGHGKFVRVHQQFVGKSGADLQELEPTQLICVGH